MSFKALAAPALEKIRDHLEGKRFIFIGLLIVGLLGFGYVFFSSRSQEELTTKDELLLELVQMSFQLEKLKTQLADEQSSISKKPPELTAAQSGRRLENTIIPVAAGSAFQQVGPGKAKAYIPRGSVFQAQLLTSIKTSIQGSVVVAETTQVFEMDSKRRIPVKTRLIGKATYDPTLKGVNVQFETMTSPRGFQYDDLQLLALSDRAWPLIEGMIFDDSGVQMGAALGFGFLSGFTAGAQDREATTFGSVAQPSVKNQVLSGLSIASFQIAEQALERMKDDAFEYVVVPAGTSIYVLFNRKWEVPVEGVR